MTDFRWDVFISHAHEDKEEVVRELASRLSALGLRIWYDEQTLTLGDSLRQRIDEGLATSRCGVVILSPAFFANEWPRRELDGLAALESNGRKVILPVWHNVERADVQRFSPTLADRLAISTGMGLDRVAAEIRGAIKALEAARSCDTGTSVRPAASPPGPASSPAGPSSPRDEAVVSDLVARLATMDVGFLHCHGIDVTITANKKIAGRSGHEYRVGLCVEFTVGGLQFCVLCDCLGSSQLGRASDVMRLAFVLRDTAAHKGLLVSPTGFEDDAVSMAKSEKIALAIAGDGVWQPVCCSPSAEITDHASAFLAIEQALLASETGAVPRPTLSLGALVLLSSVTRDLYYRFSRLGAVEYGHSGTAEGTKRQAMYEVGFGDSEMRLTGPQLVAALVIEVCGGASAGAVLPLSEPDLGTLACELEEAARHLDDRGAACVDERALPLRCGSYAVAAREALLEMAGTDNAGRRLDLLEAHLLQVGLLSSIGDNARSDSDLVAARRAFEVALERSLAVRQCFEDEPAAELAVAASLFNLFVVEADAGDCAAAAAHLQLARESAGRIDGSRIGRRESMLLTLRKLLEREQ